jgi:hypothetical protein
MLCELIPVDLKPFHAAEQETRIIRAMAALAGPRCGCFDE